MKFNILFSLAEVEPTLCRNLHVDGRPDPDDLARLERGLRERLAYHFPSECLQARLGIDENSTNWCLSDFTFLGLEDPSDIGDTLIAWDPKQQVQVSRACVHQLSVLASQDSDEFELGWWAEKVQYAMADRLDRPKDLAAHLAVLDNMSLTTRVDDRLKRKILSHPDDYAILECHS